VRVFCVHFRIKDSSWSVQNFTCCAYVYLRVLFLFVCLFVLLYLFVYFFSVLGSIGSCLAFKFQQEPMSRSMHLHYISVAAFL